MSESDDFLVQQRRRIIAAATVAVDAAMEMSDVMNGRTPRPPEVAMIGQTYVQATLGWLLGVVDAANPHLGAALRHVLDQHALGATAEQQRAEQGVEGPPEARRQRDMAIYGGSDDPTIIDTPVGPAELLAPDRELFVACGEHVPGAPHIRCALKAGHAGEHRTGEGNAARGLAQLREGRKRHRENGGL